MARLQTFLKREPVLCVSFLCALISCVFVPPDQATLASVDGRVLALLFCLMAVVLGFRRCALLTRLSALLLRGARSVKRLSLLLMLLCFFSAMVMTNDVALLTFVPLTVLLFDHLPRQEGSVFLSLPYVVTLETIAANLGSALTPVGNPQNLYLYAAYKMSPAQFFAITLPLCGVSLVLLLLLVLLPHGDGSLHLTEEEVPPLDKKRLVVHTVLFALCLFTVFNLLDWRILLGIVVVTLLFADRKILLHTDYALLGTFVCFFIFSGNLTRIDALRQLLSTLMEKSAFLVSLVTSQFISNVPAALLLRPFTENAAALVLGTDIGGLGTPVASLASLISLKGYMTCAQPNLKRYLLIFSICNLLLLLPLMALGFFLL